MLQCIHTKEKYGRDLYEKRGISCSCAAVMRLLHGRRGRGTGNRPHRRVDASGLKRGHNRYAGIAATQGYVEGPHNDESKYGAWFSKGGRVAWCAEFLTWSVDQVDQRYGTQLMNDLFPWYGGSSDGAPFFIEKGRFISDDGRIPTTYAKQWLIGSDHYLKSNEYIPFAGDYIWFFYHSRREGTEHVAVVEGVSRDEDGAIQVHVIEGNNPDRVQRAVYDLTDKRIYGFGTPVKRAYTNLRLYYQNEDVAQLQKDLITLGYYQQENKREGYFTLALKDAVKQFQKDAGISTSGIVDIQTMPALKKALERNTSKKQ